MDKKNKVKDEGNYKSSLVAPDLTGGIFKSKAKMLLDTGKIADLIPRAKEYFIKNPHQRTVIQELYLYLNKELGGFFEEGRQLAGIYAEVSKKILNIGVREYGLPPMFEMHWSLDRVGELVDQTAYVHFMRQLGRQTVKPLICLKPGKKIINSAFLPYLHDNFEIISDPNEIAHIETIIPLAPYSTFYYKYSETKYGHNNTFLGAVFKELKSKDIRTNAFELKDITIEVARKFLKDHGLKDNDDFVVLHLREAGFVDGEHMTFRNSNPLDYLAAIDWLLSLGLKVVRIGHSHMSLLPKRAGLIDLTQIQRPSEVDIFLCAKAQFYYGSSSGPEAFARHFGTKQLVTNALDYGYNAPSSLFQMTPFFDTNSNRVLTAHDIENLGLNGHETSKPFLNRGLRPIGLKSNDHLRSVKDMIEFIEGGQICRENREMKFKIGKPEFLSCFTYDSLKLYRYE